MLGAEVSQVVVSPFPHPLYLQRISAFIFGMFHSICVGVWCNVHQLPVLKKFTL